MATTIGTTQIPSDEITVRAGSTVSIGLAFERTVGFVGGMDTANGSATAGEVQEVSNPTDAQTLFGDDSELHRAAKIGFLSNIDTMYAVGVDETDETYTSGSDETSGTLANTPVMDPNLHGDESITATDDASNDITVNVVYDDPPTTPSDADTINLNPLTGDFEADASDTYTINYTYGDYASAVDALLTEDPRTVAVGAEDESINQDLANDLVAKAEDFVFSHGFGGIAPVGDEQTTDDYVSNYSDTLDEKRLSVVGSSRGYDTDDKEVRTCFGAAAQHAGVPLGTSLTKSDLNGYESLRDDFTIDNAEVLIDNQVMPLRDLPPVEIVKDMTTSTEPEFERVYSNQIADDGVERLHIIASDFIGSNFNTPAARRRLRRSLRNEYSAMEGDSPPLLDGYSVEVNPDDTDDFQVDVTVGLDIVDTVDTIDAEVSVGDVITNESE
jgi:hypothetical protein